METGNANFEAGCLHIEMTCQIAGAANAVEKDCQFHGAEQAGGEATAGAGAEMKQAGGEAEHIQNETALARAATISELAMRAAHASDAELVKLFEDIACALSGLAVTRGATRGTADATVKADAQAGEIYNGAREMDWSLGDVLQCGRCIHWDKSEARLLPVYQKENGAGRKDGGRLIMCPCMAWAREDVELTDSCRGLIFTGASDNCLGWDCRFVPTQEYIREFRADAREWEQSMRALDETYESLRNDRQL